MILELWAYQERHTDPFLALGFHWTRDFLKAAKAIAKGKPPVLPPTPKSKTEPAKYVDALNEVGSEFSPSDLSLYDEGVEQISQAIDSRRQALSFRDNAERTGQTVAEAIAGFRDHMNTGALAPDGSVRAWGNTELTQLNSWENFIAEAFRVKDGAKESLDLLNVDLALLSTSKCQELIDVVRLRPISFLSKKRTAKDKEKQLTRLERTSASGIIKVITKFFDWLDTDDDFAWTEPSKFRKLNKRPV